MEKCKKIWFLFVRHLTIFFSKTTQQNSQIFYTKSRPVCVIKVCSSGCANYIIDELMAKDNLNLPN